METIDAVAQTKAKNQFARTRDSLYDRLKELYSIEKDLRSFNCDRPDTVVRACNKGELQKSFWQRVSKFRQETSRNVMSIEQLKRTQIQRVLELYAEVQKAECFYDANKFDGRSVGVLIAVGYAKKVLDSYMAPKN